MMKNSKIILSCLISIMLATSASATWIPLTDEIPLSSLQGESLIFGDKEVSEFALSGIAGGGALPPNPDTMTVQGGQNSITGDYGLKFNFSWGVAPNQTVNATLNFKVSILPGYNQYIKDVALDITGASAIGSGIVNVGEEVWDVPFYTPGSIPIALLSCSAWEDSPLAYLTDYADFAPVKEIWVHSKDVSITGGTIGSAHISEFYQFYSQVPEPATLVLLGTAGIWIFTRKKRSA
jgi:hypothetical protein